MFHTFTGYIFRYALLLIVVAEWAKFSTGMIPGHIPGSWVQNPLRA